MKNKSIVQCNFYKKILQLFYIGFLLSMPCSCIIFCSHGNKSFVDSGKASSKGAIIFLANGIKGTAKDLKPLGDKLLAQTSGLLEKQIQVIYSEAVTSEKTIDLSMEQQVEACYKELFTLPNLKTRPIILIGHSQGGVRLAALAIKLEREGFKNIKVITLNTVFEGAPGLRFNHTKYVKEIVEKHKDACSDKELGMTLFSKVTTSLTLLINIFFVENQIISNKPGIQDLRPGSLFLSKLASNLSKSSFPILAIAGKLDQTADIWKRANKPFNPLLPPLFDKALAEILCGDQKDDNRKHDQLLPVFTQLGSNIFKNRKNYRGVIIGGTVHSDETDDKENTLVMATFNAPETLKEIKTFIKE